MSWESDREWLNGELTNIKNLSRSTIQTLLKAGIALNGGFLVATLVYLENIKKVDFLAVACLLISTIGLLGALWAACWPILDSILTLNDELPLRAQKCLTGQIKVTDVYEGLEDFGPTSKQIKLWVRIPLVCFFIAILLGLLKLAQDIGLHPFS